MSFLRGKGVKRTFNSVQVEYIIPKFIVKNSITLIYAPPKTGKSMYCCGLCNWIYNNSNLYCEYFDNDNPLIALTDRGVFDLLDKIGDRFDYIHPECLESVVLDNNAIYDAKQALDYLVKYADTNTKNYSDTVFFFDSATDFCDETNDSSVKSFMGKMKILRLAGATVIILHHTNKKDPNYKGSSVFKSASDNIYKLALEHETNEGKTYKLELDDGRFQVESHGFLLKRNYALEMLDYDEVCIPTYKREFIDEVRKILSKEGSLNQGKLLNALGKEKTDKTSLELLEEFDGKYWDTTQAKKGTPKLYSIK